jgi:hypothetical protein
MVDRLLEELLSRIETCDGAKAVFNRVLSLAIRAGHTEADARDMMKAVATGRGKMRARRAFVLGLYNDEKNVAGMRGNANAVARFLVEIGMYENFESAQSYVDRLPGKRRGGGKKIRTATLRR